MPNIAEINFMQRSKAIYEVTIDNSANPNTLSDYQILINISADPTFFSDAEDRRETIRVLDEDMVTRLNYYIEVWDVVNNNAKIWVKVPSIPASDIKKIYISINPKRTTDLSNGYNVFDFFDDFEDGVIDTSKWIQIGSGITESGGVLSITNSRSGLLSTGNVITNGVVEARYKLTSGARGNIKARATYDNPDKYPANSSYDINYRRPDSDERLRKYAGGTETILATASYTYQVGTWYMATLIVFGNTIKARATEDAPLLQATDTTHTSGRVGLGTDVLVTEGTDKIDYDWIRVRKYTEPEPTVSYSRLMSISPFENLLELY